MLNIAARFIVLTFAVFFIVIASAIIGFIPLWLLWNGLMPVIFQWPEISAIQAFSLVLLIGFLLTPLIILAASGFKLSELPDNEPDDDEINDPEINDAEVIDQAIDILLRKHNVTVREEYIDNHQDPISPLSSLNNDTAKVGRNDPCPCGSGKKYKRCCYEKSVLRHRATSDTNKHD